MARRQKSNEAILAEISAARHRALVVPNPEPRATSARYDDSSAMIFLTLDNGCLFAFPAREARGLEDATPAQLGEVEVDQEGEALHFESIDADVSVPGIIARMMRLQAWAPRLLGQKSTPAKARAARENGARGGRPRGSST